MKKIVQALIVLTFSLTLFFVGCRKKETIEVDNESQSSVDNAVADQEYSGIVPAVQDHAINTKGTGAIKGKLIAPCDSLTKISGDTLFGTPNHVDPTYTMSISNSGCISTMPDGRLRTGYLKVRLTGKIKNPGSKMIIKLIGYSVLMPISNTGNASVGYTCDSIVVTTLPSGLDTSISTKFNVKLINGVCLWGAGKTIKYSSDRTISVYPKGKPINTEPFTSVYGTANGVSRLGIAFSLNIPENSPMIKHKTCKWVDKGILELTPQGFKTRIVDFGDGTCDDKATFTVNGSKVAFTLN